MRLISLQSGSNGNCVYIEAGGVNLLIDAGISGIQVKKRLEQYSRDVRAVDAVLISHDHNDHSRCMGILHRKFGLPIYATKATYREAARCCTLGEIAGLRHFNAGERLQFGKVTVETIRTPHDAKDGVIFIVDDGKRRLGIMTDLGHVFTGLGDAIASLDAVLLESNYDPDLLDNGWYPEHLKHRIKGPGGHLSNIEAAELLLASGSKRIKWACLGHLSEENNRPKLALSTHREILGDKIRLYIASRYEASGVMEV